MTDLNTPKPSLVICNKTFILKWNKSITEESQLDEVITELNKTDKTDEAGGSPDKLKLLLIGDLGAGKTTLVRTWLHQLGVTENVTSPTFNLVNYYTISTLTIIHADLYRLGHEQELDDLNIMEDLDEPGLVLVEWGEKFPSLARKANAILVINVALNDSKNHPEREFSFYRSK